MLLFWVSIYLNLPSITIMLYEEDPIIKSILRNLRESGEEDLLIKRKEDALAKRK